MCGAGPWHPAVILNTFESGLKCDQAWLSILSVLALAVVPGAPLCPLPWPWQEAGEG